MQFLNDEVSSREKLARLTALTLLLSYIEMIFPRFIPFFRLGLANAVILISLELNFALFFLLAVLKAVASSLMGGTLFSPFFLISLAQSVLSAFVMRGVYKTLSKKLVSLYGISVLGSAVSAAVQIVLSSLYLGQGTFALLGPMLIFNAFSGIVVAFAAQSDLLTQGGGREVNAPSASAALSVEKAPSTSQIFYIVLLIAGSAGLFFVKNLYVLAVAFTVSLVLQKISGRRILLIPHISLWLFIYVSTVFVPNGEVLFKFWKLTVTQGAVNVALRKALTLSAVSALSQCAVSLKPPAGSLLALTLEYYKLMTDEFRKSYKGFIKPSRPAE